jgi:K(+)-stimulated pyrophosphate-energized sodium pump
VDIVMDPLGERQALMFLPLGLASAGLLCSIAGIWLVKTLLGEEARSVALRFGTIGATVLFMRHGLLVIDLSGRSGVWGAVLAGAVGGIVIGLVTEYYTAGSKPVERIAEPARPAPATVMITGLAVGMRR